MADSDKTTKGNEAGGLEGELDAKLLNEVDEGLGKLQEKVSGLRQQLLTPFEKMEKLTRDHRAHGKRMEEDIRKTKSLTHLSLGTAIVALLLSGVVAGMTLYLKTGFLNIQEQVLSLGEGLSVLKKNIPTDVTNEFKDALAANELQTESLRVQMETFQAELNQQGQSIAQMETRLKDQPDRAKPLVASAGEQPKGGETKIETLETKKAAGFPEKTSPKWFVNLASFTQEEYALKIARSFSSRGVPAVVKAVTVSGKIWYRIHVSGFENPAEAEAYASRVEKELRLGSVWISKH